MTIKEKHMKRFIKDKYNEGKFIEMTKGLIVMCADYEKMEELDLKDEFEWYQKCGREVISKLLLEEMIIDLSENSEVKDLSQEELKNTEEWIVLRFRNCLNAKLFGDDILNPYNELDKNKKK